MEVLESLKAQKLPELLLTRTTWSSKPSLWREGKRTTAWPWRPAKPSGARSWLRVHRATEEEERLAFDYLKQHRHLRLSAVGALSFVVMDRLGITEAFAVDHRDFGQRFTVRPGRRPQ